MVAATSAPVVFPRSRALALLLALGLGSAGCEEDLVGSVDPLVTLDPDHLDFGTVELGQQEVRSTSLVNLENVPAVFGPVTIEDDCDGCFVALDPPSGLGGLSRVELAIRFRSIQLGVATGTVTITTDDPRAPALKVTLIGRGSDTRRPDVEVVPVAVDFGFVPAGGLAVSSFAIRSTGTNDLLIDRIRIEPADAPFRITTSTPSPERPGRLVPGAQASVGLRATLPESATGTVTARVVIDTNVPFEKNVPGERGVVAVPLSALANLPPVARCGEDLNVEPWSRVTLDGSESFDQDIPPDAPLSYQWRLRSAPPGSTTRLERDRTEAPSFWADLSGTYEIELVVRDSLGLESQDPCVVTVEALPTNAVRIELIWDHPDSDLDLHLLQPEGSFCDCDTDVHYRDCGRAPNWFPMTPGANPRLDLDDRSGFGPETIDIDGEGVTRFIPDGRYRILVHYFSSNEGISSWPTRVSNATVRVFVFGLLKAELTQPLMRDGDVWVAGELRLPQQDVVPDGTVLSGLECGVF